MLAKAPIAVIPSISPDRYWPHALHDGSRDWPETNCYIDVWIEILSALNEDATAALGFTVAQDFEGDHFTFQKFPLEDLFEQFGLEVQELSIYDCLEAHVLEQTRRGRMVLVEVDSFFLPDTRGVSYRSEHTKTTIAVNRIDPARREIDYFHGPGYFALGPDDYDGVLMAEAPEGALFPYAEFVKLERRKPLSATTSLKILRRHLARRPLENPVAAFRERVRDQVAAAAGTAERLFAQIRVQHGAPARHELRAALEPPRLALADGPRVGAAWAGDRIVQGSLRGRKVFQFQLARAVARKRFESIETTLDPLVDHYARIFERLAEV